MFDDTTELIPAAFKLATALCHTMAEAQDPPLDRPQLVSVAVMALAAWDHGARGDVERAQQFMAVFCGTYAAEASRLGYAQLVTHD